MFQSWIFLPAPGYENGPEAQSLYGNGFPLQGLLYLHLCGLAVMVMKKTHAIQNTGLM